MYDILNSKLILSQADLLISQKNITTASNALISFSKANNSVIIQTKNATLTNKVNSTDVSKEGLVQKEILTQIKSLVDKVTNLIVESSVTSNKTNQNIFYPTETFTVQIYNNSQTFNEKNNLQIKNGLSIVEFDSCALELKKFYNFTSDVLIAKIDYDPKLVAKASIGDVVIKYYSPLTGELLPFENICKNNTFKIKFPIKDIEIDKDEYEKFISDGFNIYDSNSDFYSSRCRPLVNKTSEGDITIGERIENIYKNISFSCGDKCLFNEIDVNNYTVCDCIKTANSKAFVEKIVFSKLSLYNIDIITCYKNFTWVKLIYSSNF